MIHWLIIIALVFAGGPFLTYTCCKLGAYGALMGRRKFQKNFPTTPDLRSRV